MYIQKHAVYGGGNKFLGCLIGYCTYYIGYLKRVVSYVNKNAYVQIAISGANFCTACKQAVLNVLSNATRFMAIGSLGMIVTILGYIAITGLNAFICFIDMK